ncbi:MAG: hypothetical protein CMK09_10900 [Ponticaulis sp.]|nr:hypothetical protein [Ponticaulis sp.]
MNNSFLGLPALIAIASIAAGCKQEPTELSWASYGQLGSWKLLRYSAVDSPDDPIYCAAVTENIQGSSLRIVTHDSGFNVSVNGASPSTENERVDMYVYTDSHIADKTEFSGSFTDDPAFEYDHWLGKDLKPDDPLMKKIAVAETLSVSVYSPGNRSGNDWPESHYELHDASELLSTLSTCAGDSEASPVEQAPPSGAEYCAAGDQLPETGMCPSKARYLMHLPKGGADELATDCRWSVNDAALSDSEFLIYRAMSCGAQTSTLNPGSEDFPVALTANVAPTGDYTEGFGFDQSDSWSDPVVTVFRYDAETSYMTAIPRIAEDAAIKSGATYSDECRLEYDEFSGLEVINDYAEPDFESSNWAAPCGPLGAQEGATVLWSYLRPGYIAAIHFPFDGFFGIDWQTLTLVTQDADNEWKSQ